MIMCGESNNQLKFHINLDNTLQYEKRPFQLQKFHLKIHSYIQLFLEMVFKVIQYKHFCIYTMFHLALLNIATLNLRVKSIASDDDMKIEYMHVGFAYVRRFVSWIFCSRGVPKRSDAIGTSNMRRLCSWWPAVAPHNHFAANRCGENTSHTHLVHYRCKSARGDRQLSRESINIFQFVKAEHRIARARLVCAFNIHLAVVKRISRLLLGVVVLFNLRLRLSSIQLSHRGRS